MKYSIINRAAITTVPSTGGDVKYRMPPTISLAHVEKVTFSWLMGTFTNAGQTKRGSLFVSASAPTLKVEVETKEFSTNRFYVPFGIDAEGELIPLAGNDEVRASYANNQLAIDSLRKGMLTSKSCSEPLEAKYNNIAAAAGVKAINKRQLIQSLLKDPDMYVSVYARGGTADSVDALYSLIHFLKLDEEQIDCIFDMFKTNIKMKTAGSSMSIDVDMKVYIENDPIEGWDDLENVNEIRRFYCSETRASLSEVELSNAGKKVNMGDMYAFRLKQLEPQRIAHEKAIEIKRTENAAKAELSSEQDEVTIHDVDLGVNDETLTSLSSDNSADFNDDEEDVPFN